MRILNVKGIRKISVMLCSICMMLLLFSGMHTIYAQSRAELTASSGAGEKGGRIDVSLELSGNPGIWGMKFKVGYNHQVLTLESVKAGNVFAEGEITLPESLNKEQFVFYASADKLENISVDGTVAVLSFSISDDAVCGDYPVTVDMIQVIDVDGNDVDIVAANGRVTVADNSNGSGSDENGVSGDDSNKNDGIGNDSNGGSSEGESISGNQNTTGTGTVNDETTDATTDEAGNVKTNDRFHTVIIVLMCTACVSCIIFVKCYRKGRRFCNIKKIVSIMLVVVMAGTMIPMSATKNILAVTADTVSYGDVNADGKIDLRDELTLKRYIANENPSGFNFKNADVNMDMAVDSNDLQMLKKFLAEWDITLGTERCKVSFYDGERLIDVLYTDVNTPLGEVPSVGKSSKANAILLGYYTEPEFINPFFAENPVIKDMNVYAKYQEMGSTEELNITSFAQMDQSPDLSFEIQKVSGNLEAQDAVSLEVKDGSDPVELSIQDEDGDGVYTVKALNGFNEGCSYELTLAEGWNFKDKEETIRTAAFSIDMQEVEKIQMSEDIIYIQDTDAINYTVGTEQFEVLTSEQVTEQGGNFNYEDAASLEPGKILCIYVGTKPTERNSDNGGEMLDPAVYVKVSDIDGEQVTFEPLDGDDQQQLYNIPDNFPILAGELPTGETGSVNIDALDTDMYATMFGEVDGTLEKALEEIEVNDFVTIYVSQDSLTSEADLYYGVITDYDSDTGEITYERTTRQAILDSMDLYSKVNITGDDLVTEEERQELEETLLSQVEQSDFGEEAAYLLADLVTRTDGFRENMTIQDILLTDESGEPLSEEEIQLLNLGSSFELSDDIKLKVELITHGDQLHFGDGVQLAIGVSAEFEVEVEDGDKVAIDLSATFVQEVTIDPTVKGSIVYKEILWIPVPIGVEVGASVDIKSFTALSFAAEIYTVAAEDKNVWEKIKDISKDPTGVLGLPGMPDNLQSGLKTIGDVMDKIDELENNIKKATDTAEKIQGYEKDVEALWNFIEENGLTTREEWEKMEQTLGKTSVTSDLLSLMDMTTDTELSTEYLDSMQALMDKYSEMLEKETDWVKLVDQEIATAEVNILGIAIGVETHFVVRADMSIAIGSNLEYEVGKRFNFWFKIGLFKPSAGSSTMDLIDEHFAFQFYVMGKLGVKAGVQAKVYVGIGTGKFASVGITTELGPYIKLYGFFVYEYTRYRSANSQEWTSAERMAGALYLEFGLYFMLGFEANALGNLFEYSYDFLDVEIPLLHAGESRYFYACDYEPAEDESVVIRDEDNNSETGISMKLPDSFRALSYVDLDTGIQGTESLDYGRYHYTVSNPNFSFDETTGEISVNVPENIRYMECDLTITYLYGKMAFSQYDMSVTVPLVWTNLSTEELREYYTASVRVGNDEDGYQTVWSKRILKNQEYDLPTDEEIKELIGWNDKKYIAGNGYGSQQITGLTLIEDKVYDYNLDYREYSLTVEGIQDVDGSTTSRVFTAKYGEVFDFSDLEDTGTNIAGVNYTKYAGVTTNATILVNGEEQIIDLTQPVNGKVAEALDSGITATANYVEDSVTVIFTFVGITHEDVTMKIRKGDVPDLSEINSIVDYEGLAMTDVYPNVEKVNDVTTYQVTCGELTGPEATIVFDENGGSEVTDITRVVGSLIGTLPEPERKGYTFEGWYTDNGTFQNVFSERKMQENGTTLYAKWTANDYTITFHVNGGNELPADEQSRKVIYDGTYGQLPLPTKSGYGFEGWFTEAEGGVEVQSDDTVTKAADQTFYAHWKVLKEIPTSVFDFGEMETYIYKTNTTYTPDYLFEAEEGEIYEEDSFTYQYKIQGESDYIDGLPLHGGTYDLLITREADNDYAKFEYLYTAVLTIEYITFDVDACWYKVVVKENTGTGSSRSLNVKIDWSDGLQSLANMDIDKAVNTANFERYGTAPTRFYCKASGGLSRTFHLDVDVYDILGNRKNIGSIDKYWVSAPEYNWNISVPTVEAPADNINVDNCSKIVVDLTTYGINGVLEDVAYIVDNEAVTVKGSKLLIDGSLLADENNTIIVAAKYPDGDVVQITEFNVAVNTVE